MAVVANEIIFASLPWQYNDLYMVSPFPASKWPKSDPLVTASKLTFTNYFTRSTLSESDLKGFKLFIEDFPSPSIERSIQQVIMSATMDTLVAKSALLESKCT